MHHMQQTRSRRPGEKEISQKSSLMNLSRGKEPGASPPRRREQVVLLLAENYSSLNPSNGENAQTALSSGAFPGCMACIPLSFLEVPHHLPLLRSTPRSVFYAYLRRWIHLVFGSISLGLMIVDNSAVLPRRASLIQYSGLFFTKI